MNKRQRKKKQEPKLSIEGVVFTFKDKLTGAENEILIGDTVKETEETINNLIAKCYDEQTTKKKET